MGILNKMKASWASKTTAEKIGAGFDILCWLGSGMISSRFGKALAVGHGKVSGFCIRVTTAGAGIALGDIASKALKENYADPIGSIIDEARKKIAENEKKENAKNE